MRCCRTTQLDFKHEEAEGGEQTLQSQICTLESRFKDATLWLHCFFIAKATVRLKESYFKEMFEYGLEKSVWNLTLHILNCSLSQFHKTRQKSQENCRILIINFQC